MLLPHIDEHALQGMNCSALSENQAAYPVSSSEWKTFGISVRPHSGFLTSVSLRVWPGRKRHGQHDSIDAVHAAQRPCDNG